MDFADWISISILYSEDIAGKTAESKHHLKFLRWCNEPSRKLPIHFFGLDFLPSYRNLTKMNFWRKYIIIYTTFCYT